MDNKYNPILRKINKSDPEIINKAFQQQGWNKSVLQYQNYLKLQESGQRDIIIAVLNREFAGYLTINWQSDYVPFQERKIPEVVDFNVLKKYQRLGIGTALMDEAEKRIKKVSKFAGIGFGVYSDYGAAQILYINRNYKPDGRGLTINSRSIKPGETITVDDSIVMFLVKEL